MNGALLVAGTASDAGKSVLVAGLCRWLARRGVRVAPFKAQNMSLNSAVTASGAEIGRAQVMQAQAAGVAPEAAMNPVLLKPGGDMSAQVVVMGRAAGIAGAADYQHRKAGLRATVLAALDDLRGRFDVVVCEGAGSPAEINLRRDDLVNMGLARAAGLPTVVVGDIDRGGVLAAFAGTLALLEPADQALVAGFVVNRFRGDAALLAPGLAAVEELTGRPTLGVVPFAEGLGLDAEDGLAPFAAPPSRAVGRDGLTVAVVHLRRVSNLTDVDALATEPGVAVRLTTSPVEVERADLAVVPGTRATVDDLARLRVLGLDTALARRAAAGSPTLGICGGYQLLGREIDDRVESGAGRVAGLGLLPVTTRFAADKVLGRPHGRGAAIAEGVPASGYEIHHGRTVRLGGAPLLRRADGGDEGCADGTVIGTSWHGLLEDDRYRAALLGWVAQQRGLAFTPAGGSFAAAREARLDRLGDLVEAHLDLDAIERLIVHGPPRGLPTVELRTA